MSFFYFVEILNANGDVQTRHKFSQLPISLGRGYSNDFIVDDPYLAIEHAVIEMDETGHVNLRDLGRKNSLKKNGKTHSTIALDGDTVIQLGHTHLRVRDSHFVVDEKVSNFAHHQWQGWPQFFCAIIMLSLLSLSTTWLSDITDSKTSDYIMGIAKWLGFSAAWAGLWSLANRLFGNATNFGRHLFILSCGLVALDFIEYGCSFLAFSLSWESLTHYNSHLQIATIAIIIYQHLRLVNPRKHLGLKIMCTAIALIGSSLMLMTNYKNTNQYADELYMHEMLPPSWRISRNHTIAEFDQSIQQLKKDIDSECEKALKEKSQKNSSVK